MVWRRLFRRDPTTDDTRRDQRAGDEASAHSAQPLSNPPEPGEQPERQIPPHLQQAFAQRRRGPVSDDPKARLATLRRRRTAALYDVEQGELAQQEDNPWKQRVSLLNEALETVEQDRTAAVNVEPGPYHPVASLPIHDLSVVVDDEVATVAFSVGDERFGYEEPRDWAERGHTVVRAELAPVEGAVDALMPRDVPDGLRAPLREHLHMSLFVFATHLRDSHLDDVPSGSPSTLAELAPPCPVCGGWTDALGRCQTCARRYARVQELDQERDRLLGERASELEEEHRTAERLPVALRRLADIDREIAAVEGSPPS